MTEAFYHTAFKTNLCLLSFYRNRKLGEASSLEIRAENPSLQASTQTFSCVGYLPTSLGNQIAHGN